MHAPISSPRRIGLLRGINVGGHNRLPMAELRVLCAELGWSDVQTYIQSGNLLFSATAGPAALEDELQRAIERRFGFSIPVLVRSAEQWLAYVRGNPFPEQSRREPNRVLLALSRSEPEPESLAGLRERAGEGELVARAGDALWIYHASGAGRSKITPGLLDRVVGSPVTTRNWRTVVTLAEMAAPIPSGRGEHDAR